MTKPRTRKAALAMSAFLWPGAGQVYLRRMVRGVILVGASTMAILVLLVDIYKAADRVVGPAVVEGNLDPLSLLDQVHAALPPSAAWLQWVVALCWVVGMVDACLGEVSAAS
jgi:TM2 domain-containing membrane protein YozV